MKELALSGNTAKTRSSSVLSGPAGHYRLFSRLLDITARSFSAGELCCAAAGLLIEGVADWCAIWYLDEPTGALCLGGLRHRRPELDVALRRFVQGWTVQRHGWTWSRLVSLRQPLRLALGDDDQVYQAFGSRPRGRLACRLGCGSLLVAPLACRGRYLGLLIAGAEGPDLAEKRWSAPLSHVLLHLSTALFQIHRAEFARQVSQHLTETSMYLEDILETIPVGVLVVDAKSGRIASANEPALAFLGGEGEDLTETDTRHELSQLFNAQGQPYQSDDLPWARVILQGKQIAEEMVVQRDGRQPVPVLCVASPRQDERHRLAGAVVVIQDLSAQKELALQKDAFLAMVAHELRTPLTGIKGYVQLIQRRAGRGSLPGLGPAEREMLQSVERQIGRLAKLVADLMDFSAIQMSRLELNIAEFDLARLAKDVVSQMQAAAKDRHLRAAVRGPVLVSADSDRMEQVLINLISNAIKSTSPGGQISLQVHQESGQAVVSVVDDGKGIPEDIQAHVFESFFRGADSYHEGLGLGLYLAKGIIDAHRGRLWLESQVGKGTAFHFTVPRLG